MMAKMISAIEDYAAALGALDVEAFVACFSEDAILIDPYGSPPAEGEAGLRRWFKGMTRTWSEFNMTVQESYASGDRVAARWEVAATARSGKDAHFAGINVFAVNETGKLTRVVGYWSLQAMLEQIS